MKIRDLDLSQSSINTEHQALGLPPVEDFVTHPDDHPVLRAAMWAAVLILVGLLAFLAGACSSTTAAAAASRSSSRP